MNELRAERLQVMLSPDELTAVDDFGSKHRDADAGCSGPRVAKDWPCRLRLGCPGRGQIQRLWVFDRGPEGHTQAEE